MDLFSLLGEILPGASQLGGARRPMVQPAVRAQSWESGAPGSRFSNVRRGLPLMAEDDRIVNTNQGRMPLWAVEGGIQRTQPQQPKRGFGIEQGLEARGISPNPNNIQGSVNPLWQMQKGYGLYSPGEGPRTNFNRFR